MSLDTQVTNYPQLTTSFSRESVAFKSVHLFKDQTLGIGSYGKVCKAKCDDLICAAKVIHETLFDPASSLMVGLEKKHRLPIKRFERECEFLSSIRHPNIIQYLTVYIDPDTGLPALLMELMDGNLTNFLEKSPLPVPYHVLVNLCHDITLALSFLHSNSIIHRDLSSNNVLLVSHVRAKVTDFGMARLGDMSTKMSHLTYTMCPGTDVYMPPEAVKEEPRYSEKIDCFSFGVIVIQMLTRLFPKPGNRRKEVEINHPGLPSGTFEVRVSEIERRHNHIRVIDPNHPLLVIALDCLRDKEVERPLAQELCESVAALKESGNYSDSLKDYPEGIRPKQKERKIPVADTKSESDLNLARLRLAAEVDSLKRVIHLQNTQLDEKEQSIQRRDCELADVREENDQLRQDCQELQHKLTQHQEELTFNQREFHKLDTFIYRKDELIKERETQIRDQMESSEHVIGQFEERVHELEQQLTRLRVQGQQEGETEVQPQTEAERTDVATVEQGDGSDTKLRWREGQKAPYRMSSYCGVVVDGNTIYFRPGGRDIYECRAGKDWSQLRTCPISNCPLVLVNNLLTIVGGSQQDEYSNQLLSLTGEGSSTCKIWTEEFPPMPTKRSNTAAICVGASLIVAGGQGQGVPVMSTVEVMNTWSRRWSTAAHLPKPMWVASTTVCGDRVYMLGGWDKNHAAFACSLSDLLHSCKSAKSSTLSRRRTRHSSRDEAGVWKKLACLPVTWFACVTVNNQLLLIGGMGLDNQPVADVHVYNSLTDSWEVISHMTTARRQCFAALLPSNQLMVVGGITDDGDSTDTVEMGTFID